MQRPREYNGSHHLDDNWGLGLGASPKPGQPTAMSPIAICWQRRTKFWRALLSGPCGAEQNTLDFDRGARRATDVRRVKHPTPNGQ